MGVKGTPALIAFLSVLLLSATLEAFFIPVASGPTTTNVSTGHSTIQEMIDAASPGDTIQVTSGIYYENLRINKPLTLVGEDPSTTIIDGNGTGPVVYITANNVTISSFTIQGGWVNLQFYHGVYIESGSSGDIISRNIIKNNFFGILLYNSSGNTIFRNTIKNNLYGIRLYSSSRNTIDRNIITSNIFYGIYVDLGSHRNNIIGNAVLNNGVTFTGAGIYLGYSDENTIYHNNFIDNTNQTELYESFNNTWNNGAGEGNYWSDYVGEDLDGDGVGDTLIPHLGLDYYPLINPCSIPGDFNLDYVVDIHDLILMVRKYGLVYTPPPYIPEDLNRDGIVDLYDLVLVSLNYGLEY